MSLKHVAARAGMGRPMSVNATLPLGKKASVAMGKIVKLKCKVMVRATIEKNRKRRIIGAATFFSDEPCPNG